MVRSVTRGQFRVTEGWVELSPLQRLVEPIRPAVIERRPPVPRIEFVDVPLPHFEIEPLPPPVDEGGGADLPHVALPEVPGEPPSVPAPAAPLGPPAAPEPSVPAPPTSVRAPEAASTEPVRTLAALLARMWLVRSATASAANLALPAPPAPTPEASARPAPEVAPGSPPTFGRDDRRPALLPPAPPTLPSEPPAAPGLPPSPSERFRLRLPDEDDRRPVSGLASFLVEVAGLTQPPPSEPAPAVAPVGSGHIRIGVVYRLVHCPHPIPERAVSHDACRQWRIGREPTE